MKKENLDIFPANILMEKALHKILVTEYLLKGVKARITTSKTSTLLVNIGIMSLPSSQGGWGAVQAK